MRRLISRRYSNLSSRHGMCPGLMNVAIPWDRCHRRQVFTTVYGVSLMFSNIKLSDKFHTSLRWVACVSDTGADLLFIPGPETYIRALGRRPILILGCLPSSPVKRVCKKKSSGRLISFTPWKKDKRPYIELLGIHFFNLPGFLLDESVLVFVGEKQTYGLVVFAGWMKIREPPGEGEGKPARRFQTRRFHPVQWLFLRQFLRRGFDCCANGCGFQASGNLWGSALQHLLGPA